MPILQGPIHKMLKVTTHPIANIELHLLHGGNTILDIEKLVMASTA